MEPVYRFAVQIWGLASVWLETFLGVVLEHIAILNSILTLMFTVDSYKNTIAQSKNLKIINDIQLTNINKFSDSFAK